MSAATVYVVHYGSNLSSERFASWAEAARFIKFLLDDGQSVREVRKVSA